MPSALKKFAVKVLEFIGPFPNCIWDFYVGRRVGSVPPEVAVVDHVVLNDTQDKALSVPLVDLPAKPEGFLRLVFISDTHERHRQVTLPEADVLLHCGDITFSSVLGRESRGTRILADFNEWLATTPCKERVVIGGNHDVALQRLGVDGASRMLSAATAVLQDSAITLPEAKLKIYGNGWSEGDSHNKAWQTQVPEISEACQGADIVLTHQYHPHVAKAVFAKTRPKIWGSGHEHSEHGIHYEDGTLFANAAVLDSKYTPVQAPVVVDLPRIHCSSP